MHSSHVAKRQELQVAEVGQVRNSPPKYLSGHTHDFHAT
jgi:hypothetical protein